MYVKKNVHMYDQIGQAYTEKGTVWVLPWLTYSMASWPAAPSNLSAV